VADGAGGVKKAFGDTVRTIREVRQRVQKVVKIKERVQVNGKVHTKVTTQESETVMPVGKMHIGASRPQLAIADGRRSADGRRGDSPRASRGSSPRTSPPKGGGGPGSFYGNLHSLLTPYGGDGLSIAKLNPEYQRKFGSKIIVPDGKRLTDVLEKAETAGFVRLRRELPRGGGTPILVVLAKW
jgi:hypothetical protein